MSFVLVPTLLGVWLLIVDVVGLEPITQYVCTNPLPGH